MIKVSTIIPVYNSEKYLRKCIDSVLNQTLREIEIILINDGSTDTSEQIIDQYVEKYPDKIYKISKENEGQGVARNIGLKYAKGEFINFLDSDDYIEKEMLEDLYNVAKERNSDIVICDYYEIINGKNVSKKQVRFSHIDISKAYILSVAGPCNKIIKTSLLKENDIKFPTNCIYEDFAVMPALPIYTNRIEYVEKPYYYYLIRENSSMRQSKKNSEKVKSIFYVLEYLENIFKSNNKFNEYKAEIEYLYIEHLLFSGCGRFINYNNYKENINSAIEVMREKYPNWRNNEYYKSKNRIYKITCNIFYSRNFILIKLYNTIRKLIKQTI